jgi:hypothetical protein
MDDEARAVDVTARADARRPGCPDSVGHIVVCPFVKEM